MQIELSDVEIEFLIRALVCNYAEDYGDFKRNDISDRGIVGLLIGKLVGRHKKDEVWYDAEKHRKLGTPINKRLFLGTGNHSIVASNELHRRLQFAICELGGMQQSGCSEEDRRMDAEGKRNIEGVLKDLSVAFELESYGNDAHL